MEELTELEATKGEVHRLKEVLGQVGELLLSVAPVLAEEPEEAPVEEAPVEEVVEEPVAEEAAEEAPAEEAAE